MARPADIELGCQGPDHGQLARRLNAASLWPWTSDGVYVKTFDGPWSPRAAVAWLGRWAPQRARRRQRAGRAAASAMPRWAAVAVSPGFGRPWQRPAAIVATVGRTSIPPCVPTPARASSNRRRWRLGWVACVATVLLVIGAAPAEGHLPGTNATPTNYRTRILAISPPTPGLQVRVAEIGGTLELLNRTGQQVIVLGARLEPYLRVHADGGVDENRRSPTWLASRPPGSPTPRSTSPDPAAAPDWHRLSGGMRVVWHDHRAHWSGPDPPQVRRAPQRRQVVIPRWQLPLRVGDQTAVITGDVVWIPGSSWWPWLAVAAALAAMVGAAGRLRSWRLAVVVAVAVAVASDLVHTSGALLASVAPVLARVYTSTPSVAGWVLGGLAVHRLLQRPDAESGPFYLLTAGFFFAFVGGLADVLELGRSQISTVLPVAVARVTVAASLGFGTGLVIIAFVALRDRPTTVGSGNPPATR